jgi:hypothetical protein
VALKRGLLSGIVLVPCMTETVIEPSAFWSDVCSLWKSGRVPICKPARTSMPQGSVIRNHHEIELVTLDVRAPSLLIVAANLLLPDPHVLPCRPARRLEREMASFDYGAAAELFPGRHKTRMIGAVTYKRFAAAGEAIRYAVEVLPASSFLGAFLEVNEERFDSKAIRQLYESVEYPLLRQPSAIRDRPLSVRRVS